MQISKCKNLFIVIILLLSCVALTNIYAAQTVIIDGTQEGKTFEGIGGLSAGASSKLLVDYPEPYRGQVLDYLFKPYYGASFQHLKVEIPGDVNSTDGCEPSHAHTRAEFENPRFEFYDRGYEWWIMKEAKKRNPQIFLDCLEWGAPGWIGNGEFFSQDNADYIAHFILGAKKYHKLIMDYVGIWNEIRYDVTWIKNLRRTLDANGLANVKIIAPDKHSWDPIVNDMNADPDLKKAIHAIGTHYVAGIHSKRSAYVGMDGAKKIGKLLWDSEDGPWKGNWYGARELAKMYNRNYIRGDMTKTVIWSPVSSYYEILRIPNSGVMKALTPWSGYYELEPALWATAHTTQFTEPGWKYLDSGCGFLAEGSFVTLKKSDGSGDYSIIVETVDASFGQAVTFKLTGGLSTRTVHVFRTDSVNHFIQMNDIVPQNGSFTITLDGGAIYSLTTTTGQHKGMEAGASPSSFPFPYSEDFESYSEHKLPKFFMDQGGIFEVVNNVDGNGKCLRQVVPRKGIEWQAKQNDQTFPVSIVGNAQWKNYEVCSDVYIEHSGFVGLFGRVNKVRGKANPPDGCWMKVDHNGNWELKVENNMDSNTFAWGKVPFSANEWHTLKLGFLGNKIFVSIDGKRVWSATDTTFSNGMAGIASGFNYARFDNFQVREVGAE